MHDSGIYSIYKIGYNLKPEADAMKYLSYISYYAWIGQQIVRADVCVQINVELHAYSTFDVHTAYSRCIGRSKHRASGGCIVYSVYHKADDVHFILCTIFPLKSEPVARFFGLLEIWPSAHMS